MPTKAKSAAKNFTKFKLFVLPPYVESELSKHPETVAVRVPKDKMKKGPADDRFYVVDAQFKRPYDEYSYPPFRGASSPPVKAGKDGHFTHLEPVASNRAFCAASMYATVRFTLDVWEKYFGRRIEWPFRLDYKKMELIPLIEWDNAQSGYGFLEFGFARNPNGTPDHARPYCLNFDVLAHELGHSIIFSEVGYPRRQATDTIYYGGFHESAADLTAIVASLHFDKIVDHLLESTKGNLFSENELSRIGEVGKSEQIRMALNYEKMSTISDEPHDLSLPLTGAFFDMFVEMFQKELVAKGLISADLAARSFGPEGGTVDPEEMEEEFAKAYKGRAKGFKNCLVAARDKFGRLLAKTWEVLSPDNLDYLEVAQAAFDADQQLDQGANEDTIRACFKWREIGAWSNPFLSTRFSIEGCRRRSTSSAPHAPSRGSILPKSSFGGRGFSESPLAGPSPEGFDNVLGRRVFNFCRSPEPDKSFISLEPDYGEFKAMKLDEFSFHKISFPTVDAFELAIGQFAAGLHDRLVKGFGYSAQVGARAAIREIAREKANVVTDLLATAQGNYTL